MYVIGRLLSWISSLNVGHLFWVWVLAGLVKDLQTSFEIGFLVWKSVHPAFCWSSAASPSSELSVILEIRNCKIRVLTKWWPYKCFFERLTGLVLTSPWGLILSLLPLFKLFCSPEGKSGKDAYCTITQFRFCMKTAINNNNNMFFSSIACSWAHISA